MKKIFKMVLLLSAVLFCSYIFAATDRWTVNDSGDGSGNEKDVTLRWAIQQANAIGGGTIVIPGSISEITLNQGAIPITNPITIEGNDVTIQATINGTNWCRVFNISTTSTTTDTTTFKDLTIDGGNIAFNGAGILLQTGSLVLDHVTVRDGTAAYGGGIYVGGGSSSATLTLKNGTLITGNIATNSGGGIFVDNGGTFTEDSSYITANHATCNGGGIAVVGGTVNIKNNSEITYNTAIQLGGGLYVITDSRSSTPTPSNISCNGINTLPYNAPNIENNQAAWGAGVYVENNSTFNASYTYIQNNNCTGSYNGDERGAGIYSLTGNVNLKNVEICNNTCKDVSGQTNSDGGGILNEGGVLNIQYSTIYNNTVYDEGGGVLNEAYDHNGKIEIANCTILMSTIYDNTANYGAGICDQGNLGTVLDCIYGTSIVENKSYRPTDKTATVYCYNSTTILIACLLKNSKSDGAQNFDLYAANHALVHICFSCYGYWDCDNSNIISSPTNNIYATRSTNLQFNSVDKKSSGDFQQHGFTHTYDFSPEELISSSLTSNLYGGTNQEIVFDGGCYIKNGTFFSSGNQQDIIVDQTSRTSSDGIFGSSSIGYPNSK